MVGNSEALADIIEMMDKVGPTDARVLITGANGTGKELVAHGLHERSSRAKAPFIEVNCAAIPSELIESELFGHEKGSFTSAIKQRIGKFEQANDGTLFLDEIGDMSLSAQAKVLRALQEHKITRVGGDKDINVNVRVLAATNKDLKKEIAENRFREDLYHRLGVILIQVPALKDRKGDIPLLVDKFLEDIATEYGNKKKTIDEKGIVELQQYDWSGNIRELRNVTERLVIMAGDVISEDDVKKYLI
jgi:transcriptional regulator with GAF, ATPase, and Fis domain